MAFKFMKTPIQLFIQLKDKTVEAFMLKDMTDTIENMIEAEDLDGIKKELNPKEYKQKLITEKYENLIKDNRFRVEDKSVYRVGLDLTIPRQVLDRYLEAINDIEAFKAIDNFWFLCAQNVDANSRETCYEFMDNNNIKLTKSGFMVVYRWLVKDKKSKNRFFKIGNGSINLPKGWTYKSFIKDFKRQKNKADKVFVTKEGKITRGKSRVCNVEDFLREYSNNKAATYTDKHTGTMRIQMKEPANLNRKDCDPNPNASCSNGLHVAGLDWAKHHQFGDTRVVALVNPKDVVSVPNHDVGKMRVCEYLPCFTVKDWSEINEDTIDLKEFESLFLDRAIVTTNNTIDDISNAKEVEEHYHLFSPVVLLDRISDIKAELDSRLL